MWGTGVKVVYRELYDEMETVNKYSSKFIEAGASAKLRGAFFQEEANAKGLILLEAKSGEIKLFWLVDPDSEKVLDAKYFSYGGSASIAVGETLSSLAQGQNVSDAFLISHIDIDSALRVDPNIPSAPEDTFVVVDRLAKAASDNYSLARSVYDASTIIRNSTNKSEEFSGDEWFSLTPIEQAQKIDKALDGRIRDYIHNEGGEIEVMEVVDGRETRVKFHGMCGSCASSTGSTLFLIEDLLREEVNRNISVVAV